MAKNKKELKGIGGWLIVILIAFIISAASCALNVILSIPSLIKGNLLMLVMIAVYGILAFFFIYSLELMLKKKKKSVRWAIISLWIGFLAYTILVMISSSNLSSANIYYFIAVFNGIMSFLITRYLLDSKRVKNTFVK